MNALEGDKEAKLTPELDRGNSGLNMTVAPPEKGVSTDEPPFYA
jgi:hypothetical protein